MASQVERMPRVSLMLMAQLFRQQRGGPSLHRVSNLSGRGVRIVAADGLAIGEAVQIMVGCADAVGATVAWIKGNVAGLRFDEPISLDAARQRRTDYAPPEVKAGWMTEIRHAYRR